MNPEYFDFLGEQLVAASQREHRRHTARPRRWQKMGRRPLFIALAALVIAASALAATQPWAPQELTANSNSDPPTLSATPLPSAQTASFAVLRRSPTAADRGPVTRAALKFVHADGTTGVKSNDIRLLNPGAVDQPPVVLVPVSVGKDATGAGADLLCFVVVDPGVRGSPSKGGGKTCLNGEDIKVPRIAGRVGSFAFGVAPDGVTAVRATFRGADPIVVPVQENFYEFAGPSGAEPSYEVTWLDAAGRPVP